MIHNFRNHSFVRACLLQLNFSSVQFSSVQFSSVQFSSALISSVQFSSVQFSSAVFSRSKQALRLATVEKYPSLCAMNIPADEAQFLAMMLKLMNAKNTLEIGVFTGYSTLSIAIALPNDGKVLAIDMDREAYEFGLPFIKKAGVEHKVEFAEGTALSILNDLLNNGKGGTFDFALVDADKENYKNYHEAVLKLVKVGGAIAYDNTLWCGSVAYPEDVDFFKDVNFFSDDEKVSMEFDRKKIKEVNSFLASDPRIESTLISIGDGVTLCRRKN